VHDVVGVVALVRYLARGGQPTGTPAARPPTPQQILAERFARGEIDEDEYRKRMDALRTTDPLPPRSDEQTSAAG